MLSRIVDHADYVLNEHEYPPISNTPAPTPLPMPLPLFEAPLQPPNLSSKRPLSPRLTSPLCRPGEVRFKQRLELMVEELGKVQVRRHSSVL